MKTIFIGDIHGRDIWKEIVAKEKDADRVIFMDGGRLIEEGTPSEIFDNPKNQRTKDFLSAILSHTD